MKDHVYLRNAKSDPSPRTVKHTMTMRTLSTLLTCTAAIGCLAQQPAWNVHAQFRNPLWSDARLTDQGIPFYTATEPNSTERGSIALGGIFERRFANGCAVRMGYEHARNALDQQRGFKQTVPQSWFNSTTTNVDINTAFRQEINTISAGATHYMSFGRMEPYFGAEAVLRIIGDLEQDVKTVESDPGTGTLIYAATEHIRYSGGQQLGFAPIVGFRYRIACDLFLGAEFAPTWAWGEFGETRTSTSVQEFPDANAYVNQTTYGGVSGGPFFLPRFGAGVSYTFVRKPETKAPPSVPEPMAVPVK